ncbi:autotransporter assembly complex protein TamA [Roseitranquillus sediminis]|uniref:autotransporter assembly complex protein TamA n=1 Tax=Roseitranquillus sediminis TaxID=2809051 RepID=UPI001D0C6DA3|nr:BamA/TamA family outer membrane protein [Roseitranquillus sediminis]MBM9596206.1 BamA/TamA family outer membrane protein [Roseitranquillus sediminis]
MILAAGAVLAAAPVDALRDVRFRTPGASEELERRLESASLLLEIEDEVDDPQEVLAAARAEYGRLLGVLYSQGHFGGVINVLVDGQEAAAISPLSPPREIGQIEVRVQPGPTYLFSDARVVPLAPGTELPSEFAVGEPARTPVIRDAVDAAVEGWREEGHPKAEAGDQDIVARHAQERVEARIGIRPGPQARFGDFIIAGNENVRERAIRRIAGFPDGDTFSPERLERSAERLRRSGAFRSVALVEADTLDPDDTLDITVRLVEERPRRFGFGAEVSTTEGVTLTAFWLHRNLFGGAERFRVDGEVSGLGGGTGGVDYTFSANFNRPATFNVNNDLYVRAQVERLEEPSFISNNVTFGAGINRRIGDTFTLSAGVGYRFDHDEDESGETTEYSLLTFPIEAMADRRDVQLNPTTGWYAEAEVTPFLGLNDAAGSGARLTFDGRVYRGFGEEDRLILAGRFQFGSIVGAELTDVPNAFRFYSGGGGTVRGLDYQSLGVTLDDGTETGGASFLGLSAEARIGVRENLQLVTFADYGFVSDESFLGGEGDDHVGAGLGLRYITPIGPIRLDVATPVTGDDAGGSIQVYVGIGQAF